MAAREHKRKTRESGEKRASFHPFRAAVLRGLGVVLPPLVTIGIFAWVGKVADENFFKPVIGFINHFIIERYVGHEYTNDFSLPLYILVFSIFILTLYLVGKFVAARIGRMLWMMIERVVSQIPLVRNVYGAVKQVSDFVFSEREIEYSRIVAVEWPRRGIWSLALVTGESMLDIEAAANEPVLSVLIPTSPMPMTGFALTVKKSETIDLKISFDEAIQFIVSCGVVVPPNQMRSMAAGPRAPGLAPKPAEPASDDRMAPLPPPPEPSNGD